MSEKSNFDITNIPGLNTMTLGKDHYEIAVINTNISFTLVHDNHDQTHLFGKVKPDDLAWFVLVSGRIAIIQWIGDENFFLKHSSIAVSKIFESFKKKKHTGNVSIICVKIISVEDPDTGVIEFINNNETNGHRYKVYNDEINNNVALTRV